MDTKKEKDWENNSKKEEDKILGKEKKESKHFILVVVSSLIVFCNIYLKYRNKEFATNTFQSLYVKINTNAC